MTKFKKPKYNGPKLNITINNSEKKSYLNSEINIRINGQEILVKYKDISEKLKSENKKFLGAGKFGAVYELELESNINLAVKVINFRKSENENETIPDQIVPEKIGNTCQHIINFYGAISGGDIGNALIFHEKMDMSLQMFYEKVFKLKKSISELILSKIAYSVLTALHHLESENYLHRDIKPANILINSKGEIKLCDFSISGTIKLPANCTNNGSFPYLSPEKLKITDGYGVKSDIWSLGVSLIEIATNKHPFSDFKSDFDLSIYLSKSSSQPPEFELDSKLFSKKFRKFIKKCLVKDKHKRSTCLELLADKFITKYQKKSNDLIFIQDILNNA